MNQISKFVQSAIPGTGKQFRKRKYGGNDIRSFLIDVLGMANASIEGPRFIVVGVDFDGRGRKRIHAVDEDDFSGKPSYQSLANEYIEPPIRIRYQPANVEGKCIGVFEIGDCQDRPYMMRVDHSEKLRRGDAYMRVNDTSIKMGRRQFQDLFAQKFRESVSTSDIEIGFPGEIIHKDLLLNHCNLEQMPSAQAGNKLKQLIDIQRHSRNSGSTSLLARMTHARLYGSDDPYINRTIDDLMQEMKQIRETYRDFDNHFLFETRAERVQMVVYNQGQEPIVDASLTIVMPNHNSYYVADRLPKSKIDKGFSGRSPDEIVSYPSVSLKDDSVQVTSKIGDIPVGRPVEAFASPLRVCAGNELRGRRLGVHYVLHGKNLRTPAKGRLRLIFRE